MRKITHVSPQVIETYQQFIIGTDEVVWKGLLDAENSTSQLTMFPILTSEGILRLLLFRITVAAHWVLPWRPELSKRYGT